MFDDKKVLVCGMARSGQSAAILLTQLKAKVTVQDMKPEIEWDFASLGLKACLGRNPDDIVEDFDLIIISPGISVYSPFVVKAQKLGIPVWGEAELAYRLCPCPMVAITGTNGKTTVTTLVGEILKKFNSGTVIAGNIGTPLTKLVNELTPANIVAAEISSFQLETIAAFRPKISAVLNMTPDHLDRHKTMENYIAMKSRIFENQTEEDFCILNYDNHITRVMKPPSQVIYFSVQKVLEKGVYLQDGYVCAALNDSTFRVIPTTDLKILAENAVAAVAICLSAGVPVDLIAEGIQQFSGVEHRLQHIKDIKGISFYNDSKATNTDAAIKALEAFNKPVTLICGGSDKKADFTPWVQLFEKKAASVIVIGETACNIIDTCRKVGYSAYHRADSLENAVKKAAELAPKGGVVLLSPACASFDMFKNFEERGNLFVKYVQNL